MVARLREISVRFGRRWVLVRLELTFEAGKIFLLTGENGAGKTTLLRLLATAIKPTRGEYDLFGYPVRTHLETLRPRLALITHHNHLYDDLSPLENLDLMARLSRGVNQNLMAYLERVGLEEHAHRPVRHFSAGMKRRLCLARLLLKAPEVALLDEPFGQLDPQGVTLVEDCIHELHRRGTTLVLSTHDIARGLALADRHIKLKSGRLDGPMETLRP
ncbi:MAG: heme ABC exporter ATP-binding protein CcmA [Myxococcota bacterium]